MSRRRDILRRFRLAGAPGAATKSGVPADRVGEAAAELGPVLESLADTQRRARRIREDAEKSAVRIRATGVERANALVAAAHLEAAARRSAAATRVAQGVDEERVALLDDARAQAAAIRECAAQRMPRYVDRVVAEVQAAMQERRVPGS